MAINEPEYDLSTNGNGADSWSCLYPSPGDIARVDQAHKSLHEIRERQSETSRLLGAISDTLSRVPDSESRVAEFLQQFAAIESESVREYRDIELWLCNERESGRLPELRRAIEDRLAQTLQRISRKPSPDGEELSWTNDEDVQLRATNQTVSIRPISEPIDEQQRTSDPQQVNRKNRAEDGGLSL